MPEEETQVQEQEGTQVEGQEETQTESPDWENQYNELRGDYTKKTQKLSEYERTIQDLQSGDPERQGKALQSLGLLEEEEEEDFDFDEGDESESALLARLARLEQKLQSQDAASQEESAINAEVDYLDTELTKIEKKIGRELEEDEVQLYGYVATQMRDEEGRPDVAAAHKFLSEQNERNFERYKASKSAPQLPTGKPGEEKLDLDDPDVRVKYMAERVKASKGAYG